MDLKLHNKNKVIQGTNARLETVMLDHPSYTNTVGEGAGKRRRTRSWLCNQLQVGTTGKWSVDARSTEGDHGRGVREQR